jgi:hypothetical protein
MDMGRDAFRKAAAAGDMRGLAASLDPEVHFRGPAFATPDMVGRDRVAGILTIAFERVYEDFRYMASRAPSAPFCCGRRRRWVSTSSRACRS